VPSVKQGWLISFSIAIILAIHVSLFFAMAKFQLRKPDFAALYQAGRATDHERFPWVLDRFPVLKGSQFSVQTAAGTTFPADTMHPPHEMVIYAALAFLKFRIAYPFWWACNLCFLFYSAFLLWRYIPNLRRHYPFLLILIATFFPVLVAMVQGQNTTLLLVLLTICLDSLERQKPFRAGFVLSMGMFKFVLVIPMLIWLILEKRWKSLAGFASGCAGLLVVAIWLVGINGVETYVRMLAGYGKATPEAPGTESIMPNLRGLVQVIGTTGMPSTVLTVVTLISSVALLIWVDLRISKQADLSIRFSIQVLLATLVSFHLYPHDATVLVLPVLVLLNSSLRPEVDRRSRTAFVICAIGIYLLPLCAPLQLSMPVIGIAALVLLAWVQYWPKSEAVAMALP
jgi:hypothetical protein